MKTLTLREKVGNRIRLLRKSHNHSQEFLSEKINVSKDRISKTERGIAFINDELLDGLCKFYNVKVEFFSILLNFPSDLPAKMFFPKR